MEKTAGIIVLYNPAPQAIADVIRSLTSQTDVLYLVDNSEGELDLSAIDIDTNKVKYIPLHANLGIAEAQNVALRECLKTDINYVVFSDQDSIVPDNTAQRLLATYQRLSAAGLKVGAVGCKAINKDKGVPYGYGPNLIRPALEGCAEVTYARNSVSLFHIDYFRQVGLMDSALFIDGVDSELCWRGKHLCGYRFFIDEDIVIQHQLGLGMRTVAGTRISLSPASRMRYMYRNYLWLARRNYTPRKWIVVNGMKYIAKAIYYPLVMSNRKEYIKQIWRGVKEGMG